MIENHSNANYKLALLATSVMFFPKAGHTIKPKDENAEAGLSRQLRAGGNDSLDLMSIEQLNIAESSSGPLSTATAGTPSLVNNIPEVGRLFGRYFIPSEKIINNLILLRRTNPSEAQEITNAIRDKLLGRFTS